jgi:hypothetical protein
MKQLYTVLLLSAAEEYESEKCHWKLKKKMYITAWRRSAPSYREENTS